MTRSRRRSRRSGGIDLWRVAVQPGKPLAFGRALAPMGGRCLLFGLPGQPGEQLRDLRAVRPARCSGAWPVTIDLVGRTIVRARLVGPDADRSRGDGRSCASAFAPTAQGRLDRDAGRRPGLARAVRARRGRRAGHRPRGCRRRGRRCRGGGHAPRRGAPRPDQPMTIRPFEPTTRKDRRRLTHVDRRGRPRMVDVSDKPPTARRAVAEARGRSMDQETLSLVIDGAAPRATSCPSRSWRASWAPSAPPT